MLSWDEAIDSYQYILIYQFISNSEICIIQGVSSVFL